MNQRAIAVISELNKNFGKKSWHEVCDELCTLMIYRGNLKLAKLITIETVYMVVWAWKQKQPEKDTVNMVAAHMWAIVLCLIIYSWVLPWKGGEGGVSSIFADKHAFL